MFPYVNGGLFADEEIEIPPFTEELKDLLLRKASEDFDWSGISPTIFGAVFESTLNPETRRSGGRHYTSIENIHKVIDFAVTVAKTALWIAESQMMKETERIIHANLDFLPLKSYANIVEGNALRLDWEEIAAPISDNAPLVKGGKETQSGFRGDSEATNPSVTLRVPPPFKKGGYKYGKYIKSAEF